MTSESPDMSTDEAWEEWGRRDPYYGVITDPKFRRSGMTEELKREFFESGANQVRGLFATIRRYIDPAFTPTAILDFGCGVGRLLVPFAAGAKEVVGMDVSPSMLLEAKRNCEERHLTNVALLRSDDELSALTGTFDLIHSFIVFQHIPVDRGRAIIFRLFEGVRPGGVIAIHVTYSKASFAATHGIAPAKEPSSERVVTPPQPDADPVMQMNAYNINELLFSMQRLGYGPIHIEFTDHAGELGLYLFSARQRPHGKSGTI